MNILRPPGGFRVTLNPGSEAAVEAANSAYENFRQHWTDIVDRLRFTAHLEGIGAGLGAGDRVWSAEPDDARNLPRVVIAYHVLGANVRIKLVKIDEPPDFRLRAV